MSASARLNFGLPLTRSRQAVAVGITLALVVSGLSLGGASLAAHAAGGLAPLTSLKGFTILTEGNLTTEGNAHEVEGSAAVGGDFIVNKAYIVGSPHSGGLPVTVAGQRTQLVINGTLQMNVSGEALNVNAGATRIGNTVGYAVGNGSGVASSGNNFFAIATPDNRLRMQSAATIAALTAGTLFADTWGTAFSQLRANTAQIAGYTAADAALISFVDGTNFNGISGNDKGLSLVAGKPNVLRVSAAQLSSVANVKFLGVTPSATTPLIIDVTDSGSVSLMAPVLLNINDAYVLWNFAPATSLALQGRDGNGYIEGSILAPNAAMTFVAGYIEGQIAVKSLVVRSGGEIHHIAFDGDLPSPQTVSTTPSYTDGSCAPTSRTNTLTAPEVNHIRYTWTANPVSSLVGTTFTSFSSTSVAAGTYSFTIAATDGYMLTGASSFSHTFSAPPVDCRVAEATGSFSFTPPTCTTEGSYTLGALNHASYSVSVGGLVQAAQPAGTYPMQADVEYIVTVVPDENYSLAPGVTASGSANFPAATDCVLTDATGSFTFLPPTCSADGSYTLDPATHARYSVSFGGATVTQDAGTFPLTTGVEYTITIVPNAGHALVAGTSAPRSALYQAPTDCVTSDATGGFAFAPPTCDAAASFTLLPASHATYSVSEGGVVTTRGAGSYPMQTGVDYIVTIVPDAGHALATGVVGSGSENYAAASGCVVTDATGSFTFLPPTCTTTGSFTLNAATNARYAVTSEGATTTRDAGTFAMTMGVEYTIAVVADAGHALVSGTMEPVTRTFSAPTDCFAYVDTDPDGSTCDVIYPEGAPEGLTSWIRILPDPRVVYTIDSVVLTDEYTQVAPGTHVVRAVAATGYVLSPEAEKTWTIVVQNIADCEPETPATLVDSTASASCDAGVPWINYRVVLTDPYNLSTSREAHLVLSDDANTENITLGEIGSEGVLEGRILWPGASIDSEGAPTGWPGWELTSVGEWAPTTGNFAWTRALDSVTISVNPTIDIDLSYPAEDACADPTGGEPLVVTPTATFTQPTCTTPGSYTLSMDPAILWTVDGATTTAGTVSVAGGATVTAVARPADGYVFPSGYEVPTVFTFDFVQPLAGTCTITASTTPQALPLTGFTGGVLGLATALFMLGMGGLFVARRRQLARHEAAAGQSQQ